MEDSPRNGSRNAFELRDRVSTQLLPLILSTKLGESSRTTSDCLSWKTYQIRPSLARGPWTCC